MNKEEFLHFYFGDHKHNIYKTENTRIYTKKQR